MTSLVGEDSQWPPSCSLSALRARAKMLSAIRRFFEARGVLEVETPLMGHAAGSDPHLDPFVTAFRLPGRSRATPLYLQTSPEFAMKRLLAAGSGSIFQICKAFRNEELGRLHNPEFTLLEWYRVGFWLEDLMDEIEALFLELFPGQSDFLPARRVAYAKLFEEVTGIDPIRADLQSFEACAERHALGEARSLCGGDRTLWLDLLFSHLIQPQLGFDRLCFVYDYPACLPSLARKKPGNALVVERVELFLDGLELGNGFHELADAEEQEKRFDAELALRQSLGLPQPPRDERLLAALRSGLPDCCGVAMGLDRLLMLLTGAEDIGQVLAFPVSRS